MSLQRPAAAHPRTRVLRARRRCRSARRASPSRARSRPSTLRAPGRSARLLRPARLDLIGRRCNANACHLGEQPDLVVPPAGPGHRSLPEVGVGGVVDDAFLAGRLQRSCLRLAHDRVPAVNQRVHVLVDRIGGGHHEDARASRTHLVLVEPHGRKPVVPRDLRHVLALLLREHVHVAVVVVAGVRVIEDRQRARLVRRAEVPVEPVGDQDLAVGIQARHEQQDDVVENLPGGGRIVGRQVMHEIQGHLRRTHFGGVNAARRPARRPCPA